MNAIPIKQSAGAPGGIRWVRLCVIAACLSGLALLGLLFFQRLHLRPVELSRHELELREGRLYRTGESRPFDGFLVERYPDGALLSRSAIVNGQLEGPSEGWYTNGQLQIRETYRQGLADGLRIKWYPEGTTQSVAHLVRGQYHGLYQRWHENGRLAEEVVFENGQPHGVARAYYPSGHLKAEVRLEHGQILDRRFFPDPAAPDTTVVPAEFKPAPTNVAGP